MTFAEHMRVTALLTLVVAGVTSSATAQTTGVEPQHPNTTLAQATPGQAPSVQPAQPRVVPAPPEVIPAQPRAVPAQPEATPAQPGLMQPGMMGQGMMQPGTMRPGMMGQGMTCPMMGAGMMGGAPGMGPRRHMMRVMFAIADTNGDGALSFEEVMAVHKRIFDLVDTNKDGKVTLVRVWPFRAGLGVGAR